MLLRRAKFSTFLILSILMVDKFQTVETTGLMMTDNVTEAIYTILKDGAANFTKLILEKGTLPIFNLKKNVKEILSSKPLDESIVSKTCAEDMQHSFDMQQNQFISYSPSPKWQQQMFDAFFSIPTGLSDVNLYWLGDFTECTQIEVWKNTQHKPEREPDFLGKYCIGTMGLFDYKMAPIRIGVCIPSTCRAIETQTILNNNMFPLVVQFEGPFCNTKYWKSWDKLSIAIGTFFVFLILIMVTGSLYEIYLILIKKFGFQKEMNLICKRKLGVHYKYFVEEGMISKILLAFSAYKNTKKILNTSDNNKPNENLTCIHGIKAISMIWVVYGHHTLLLQQNIPIKNLLHSLDRINNIWYQIIASAEYAVDTFLYITGFLLVYAFLVHMKKSNGKFNIPMFYLHRILRLTPAYALVYAYMCGPFPQLNNGPIWTSAAVDRFNCKKSWWQHLLYISVYFPDDPKCLPQLWYLCLDMFYYIASPILLVPLLRKPRIFFYIWSFLLVYSMSLSAYRIQAYNLSAFGEMNAKLEDRKNYVHYVYNIPWCRMHVTLIGMLFGYIYYKNGKNIKLSKHALIIGWSLVTITILYMTFGMFNYMSGKRAMSRTHHVLFGTFARPIWALCMSWILITCITGYGGVVNTILSCKFLLPISRLSYSSFLVHFTVMAYYYGSRMDSIYLDNYIIRYLEITNLTATLLASLFLTLLIELPVIQLEGMLLGTSKQDTSKKTQRSTSQNETSSRYSGDHDVHHRVKTQNKKIDIEQEEENSDPIIQKSKNS